MVTTFDAVIVKIENIVRVISLILEAEGRTLGPHHGTPIDADLTAGHDVDRIIGPGADPKEQAARNGCGRRGNADPVTAVHLQPTADNAHPVVVDHLKDIDSMLGIALTVDSRNRAPSPVMRPIFIGKSRNIRPGFFIGGSRNGVKTRRIAPENRNPIPSIIICLNISKGPSLARREDYPIANRLVGAYPVQGVKIVHADLIEVDAIVG